MDDTLLPVVVAFAAGATLHLEAELAQGLPIIGNGPPGTFVHVAGVRVSLPTDQIVQASTSDGAVQVTFWGMRFAGPDETGRLIFDRVRERLPEAQLSQARSHRMVLEPEWVTAITAHGVRLFPLSAQEPGPGATAIASHTPKRRPRYPGRNPRQFHEKYKEHAPGRYPETIAKVLASGKTPAGMHLPIMVGEVLQCLTPAPGEVAVDCTLGGGGHAQAILERLVPGGRLIGIDADPLELPKTEARLRALGYGPDTFIPRHANFAALPHVIADLGLMQVDVVMADLGVSSMQIDNPDRGFTWKGVGPLDMRMNPGRGEPASALLARIAEDDLAALLVEHADEPHAVLIAHLLTRDPVTTSHAAERVIRMGLAAAKPTLSKAEVKMSVRRTFQALRIAVNDEFAVLEALLRSLPYVLAPGGRVAILTFHSGEDRRVKKAFQAGRRAGIYADISDGVIQSTMEETRANRRASSAKLRWAVRA